VIGLITISTARDGTESTRIRGSHQAENFVSRENLFCDFVKQRGYAEKYPDLSAQLKSVRKASSEYEGFEYRATVALTVHGRPSKRPSRRAFVRKTDG
jgi:hypothetical protein